MSSTAAAERPSSHPQPATAALRFSAHASGSAALTQVELERFQRTGWIGNYPLLEPAGVARLTRLRRRVLDKFTQPTKVAAAEDPGTLEHKPWFKSMHAYVPEYHDVACHPAIVGRVASILGPDLMAWGLTLTRSAPGGVHRWHVDVEHRHWEGVSVFLGLANLDMHTTLKVLEGSHRVEMPPQDHGVIIDDDAAVDAVRREVPEARSVRVPMEPGEFFLFAGRLWHASHNTGQRTRIALIIHYSRPDAKVRVPLNFDEPLQWHVSQPPCVLVRGEDRYGVNRLVGRPAPDALPVKAGYVITWEFLAAPGKIVEFKRIYGPEGDWVQLFRRAPGYIRSELLQDQTNTQRFLTVDYWESEEASQAFRAKFLHEYEDLDVHCEQYTVKEREIGRFRPAG